MKTVAVSPSEHETACKLIDDDDFSVLYDIVHITLHDGSGFKCLHYVMVDFHVFRVTEVFDGKEFLRLFHTRISKPYFLFLFLNGKVLAGLQGLHKSVGSLIKVGGIVSLT